MAKKKKGRKMPSWRKAAKAIVGIVGRAIGVLVAVSPVIEAGTQNNPLSDTAGFADNVGYRYTAGYGKDIPRGLDTYGRLAAGIIIMWAFGKIAKRV